MISKRRRGRPRSERRQAVHAWMAAHAPFTMGQLSQGLGLSMEQSNNFLQRAKSAREVRACGTVLADCKRPVALFEPIGADPGALHRVVVGWKTR